MILNIVLILILVLIVALVGTDGLWHNLLVFFNVLFAGTLTINFFEPFALWLDYKLPTYTYVVDILAFWGLFAMLNIVLSICTRLLSKVRVRFIKPVDTIGGIFVSLWTGWIMVALILISLHVAPLPLHSFGGTFQPTPESRMFFGLAPDRMWLAWMHQLSKGGFSRSASDNNPDEHVFDPKADFILTYGGRRSVLEELPGLRVERTWGSGLVQNPPTVTTPPPASTQQ